MNTNLHKIEGIDMFQLVPIYKKKIYNTKSNGKG